MQLGRPAGVACRIISIAARIISGVIFRRICHKA
jgi:hypothetical protein